MSNFDWCIYHPVLSHHLVPHWLLVHTHISMSCTHMHIIRGFPVSMLHSGTINLSGSLHCVCLYSFSSLLFCTISLKQMDYQHAETKKFLWLSWLKWEPWFTQRCKCESKKEMTTCVFFLLLCTWQKCMIGTCWVKAHTAGLGYPSSFLPLTVHATRYSEEKKKPVRQQDKVCHWIF